MSNRKNLIEFFDENCFYKPYTENIFLLGLAILVFAKFLGLSFEDWFYKLCTLMSLFCLGIKIMTTKYTKKEILNIVLLMLFAVLTLYVSGRPALPMSIIVLIASKGININRFIKVFKTSGVTGFLAVILSCALKIIPNTVIYMDRVSHIGTTLIKRYSLGYYHPNATYIYFFILLCLHFYNKTEKEVNNKENFILILLTFILYKLTLSRTGLICCLSLILLIVIHKSLKRKMSTKIYKLISFLPILIGVGIIILSLSYTEHNVIMSYINKLLSGRLYYNKIFLLDNTIPIIGINMDILNESVLFLDSSYILTYFSHGIIFYFIFLFGYVKLLYNSFGNKKHPLQGYCMIILLFYCITEYFITNIFINFTLIHFKKFIFEQ